MTETIHGYVEPVAVALAMVVVRSVISKEIEIVSEGLVEVPLTVMPAPGDPPYELRLIVMAACTGITVPRPTISSSTSNMPKYLNTLSIAFLVPPVPTIYGKRRLPLANPETPCIFDGTSI